MSRTQTKLNWDQINSRPAHGYFSEFRSDLVGAMGEFLGTLAFLLMGLGGIQAAATSNAASLEFASIDHSAAGSSAINTVASIDQLIFIAVSMGLSLLCSAWIFYRATGAAFNPNVSFALLLIGVISPVRFVMYFLAQTAASIAACALLQAILPGPLTVTPSLGAGTTPVQGIFIECFATCALILSVLFLAVEKHRATFLAPLGIGLTLFSGHLFATVYTGAAMNSARALGPSVITGFGTDHWVYWVGPTLGSLLSVIIYVVMKRYKYWTISYGQDTDMASQSPMLFVDIDRPLNPSAPRRPSRVGLGFSTSLPRPLFRTGSSVVSAKPEQSV